MTDADHPRREVPLSELRIGQLYLLELPELCCALRYLGSYMCPHPLTSELSAAHVFDRGAADLLALLGVDGSLEDLDGNLAWHLYQDSRRHRSQDAEMRQHLRRINCE